MAIDPISLGIMGGSSLAGGLLGGQGQKAAAKASKHATDEATRLREEALSYLMGLNPLDIKTEAYNPEMLQYLAGAEPIQYTSPETISATTVEDSPEMRAAQIAAMQNLRTRTEEGLTARDLADFMGKRRSVEEAAAGQMGAIEQGLAARGMSKAGLGAVLQAQAGQSAIDRLSQESLQMGSAAAQARALAELNQGQLAGQIRGEDISLSQTNANILNQIAQENSARRNAINALNTQLQNESLKRATDEQRRISDANIGQKNTATLSGITGRREADIAKQQSVQDIAKAKAGALTGQIPSVIKAGASAAQAARSPWESAASALSGLGNIGYGAYNLSQQQDQKNNELALLGQIFGSKPTTQPVSYGGFPTVQQPIPYQV